MKLSEYKQDYYTFTGKLSDINRQIAFAGIALIWIFKKTTAADIKICTELTLPAVMLAIGLGIDMLQYIYQSIAWAIFHRHHEIKENYNEDVNVISPSWMNYPSWILFALKILFIISAYTLIIIYLANNLF